MDTNKIDQFAATLDELLRDENFRAVALPTANFWDIIHYGESSYENRYNRMFSWLLDPTANHGLGARVVNGLIEHLGESSQKIGTRKVRTETETAVPAVQQDDGKVGLKGRIDVTVNDTVNQIYVALECKMSSSQHTEQLGRYRTWVQDEYQEYNARLFVFLTEAEESPADDHPLGSENEIWVNVTFQALRPIIQDAVKAAGQTCSDDARIIIEQFLIDQERRSAESITSVVENLYFKDESLTFGDVMLAAVEALELEDTDVRSYAKLKKIVLPAKFEDSVIIHEKLISAFEALGRTSTDLDRVLTLCWEHKPNIADHSKSAETVKIIRAFASSIAGQEIQLGQELPANGSAKFFESIYLSRAGQSAKLGLHNGELIYFAGNNLKAIPTVMHHWVKNAPRGYQLVGCALNEVGLRRELSKSHDGDGAKLAENFVNYLTEKQLSGELQCSCGHHMTGLIENY
ncbi:PD-(D/E)XK nuclease family protein [Glutamicibacter ardleyensis]|uniref:PD-(D/E)XK nuclease family protein n=1 Tax=Glutamicibacter ardleyensis TaxID=225894 RepID=UPI003F94FA5A